MITGKPWEIKHIKKLRFNKVGLILFKFLLGLAFTIPNCKMTSTITHNGSHLLQLRKIKPQCFGSWERNTASIIHASGAGCRSNHTVYMILFRVKIIKAG